MRAVGAAVVKVHSVVAIQVRAGGSEIGVPVPDRAGIVRRVEHEGVGMLAQAVQAGARRKAGAEAEVLRFENKARGGGVEEGLIGTTAENGEAEGRLDVVEDQISAVGAELFLGMRGPFSWIAT